MTKIRLSQMFLMILLLVVLSVSGYDIILQHKIYEQNMDIKRELKSLTLNHKALMDYSLTVGEDVKELKNAFIDEDDIFGQGLETNLSDLAEKIDSLKKEIEDK